MHMRRNVIQSILIVIGLVCGAGVARGDGLIIVDDRMPPPGPEWRPSHAFAPLEVRQHQVSVRIDDQVAVTEVDQTFYNPHGVALEGTYLFPIPKGAQIDKFAMDIDGSPVEAELLDAEKARRIYEDIVRKARDPALLEYAGQGLFKVRIFPLEAHREKRVQLKYTQLLKEDSGLVEYTYPLNTEKFSAAPLRSVGIRVDIDSPRGVKTVYSPTHAIEIKKTGPTRTTVGFEAKDVRPDTDFQVFFARESDSADRK